MICKDGKVSWDDYVKLQHENINLRAERGVLHKRLKHALESALIANNKAGLSYSYDPHQLSKSVEEQTAHTLALLEAIDHEEVA